MAGSENSVKIIGLLVLYFALMATILALVTDLTGDDLGITIGSAPAGGTYCDDPRTIYDVYNLEGIPPESMIGENQYTTHASSLECKNTVGIRSQDECEAISGCSWDETTAWYDWLTGDQTFTCNGHTDYSINYTTIWFGRRAIVDGEQISVCDYPTVQTNQTLCEAFSCDWAYHGSGSSSGLGYLEPTANINQGLIGSIMDTIGGMFTLRFDYGFTNDNANAVLNLLLFWLPFLALLVVLYQLIPFI